jgi:hypothetical protein
MATIADRVGSALEDDAELVAKQRARAVRAVAAVAADADDCRMLLDALGLSPHEGVRRVPAPRRGR